MGRDCRGRAVVVGIAHQRPTHFEHTRGGGAAGQRVVDDAGVDAGLHAKHHRFGRRDVVDGDEVVGDVLHDAAIAECAEEDLPARHGVKRRERSLIGSAVAAGEDHEVLDGGLGTRAAQRTIEQHLATADKRFMRRPLDVERQRRTLDRNLPAPARRGDAVRSGGDRGKCLARRERQKGDRALFGNRARRWERLAAGRGQLVHRRRNRVVTEDLEAAGNEVARHGHTHDADADHSDLAIHVPTIPNRCRKSPADPARPCSESLGSLVG